jgi:hypothetical protein
MGARGRRAGGVRAAVRRSWLAGLLAVALVGCASSAPPPPAEANPWIGKSRRAVVGQLGEPTQMIPLVENGGKMMIYAQPDRPHYVFEFGPDDKVYRATELK